MARRFPIAPAGIAHFAIALLVLVPDALISQTQSPVSAPTSQGAGQVWLGQSLLPLNGPWRFTTGDSPLDPATHTPLWAQPAFDDSHWETLDLSPKPGWKDPYNGDPRYIRGWTATGHPGYIGWAWYRLRVQAASTPGEKLALSSPIYVDDGYQVFANGQLIGQAGDFTSTSKAPTVYATAPATFPIPPPSTGSAGARPTTLVIAFRVWMGPMGYTHSAYAGGLHYAPVLGESGAIQDQVRLGWLELTLQSAYAPFEGVLLFLLGSVAFGLILFDRTDRVYLWLGSVFWFTALSDAALTVFTLMRVLTLKTYFMFFDVFSNPLVLCGWIMVWWFWFRLKRPAWIPKATAVLMVLYMVSKAVGGDFFYGSVAGHTADFANLISVLVRVAFLPLFCCVVGLGIRKQGVEGWLVLPAVIPLAVSQFASELIVLNLPVKWAPFGITIFVGQVANLVSAAAISLLMLRRLQLTVRLQRERALDLKQAQEMQRMLIPETLLYLPGFRLSSAYRPALEVGGDFFQIIPRDGGAIEIIMGDVSGKGLKAAMAVSLIMGSIRILADQCMGPADFLYQLNRRLIGRMQGGFASCIAVWVQPDGHCTISGAGHPSPFVNDREIDISGALPLGVKIDGFYDEREFTLCEGDCLTLYTDGLPEARNADGELYGFQRLKNLIAGKPTPQEAADIARNFGQHDDVTILTLTRVPTQQIATPVMTSAVVFPA